MTSLALVWDLIANDAASPVFSRVGTAAEGMAVKTDAATKSMGGLGKAFVFLGGATAIIDAVKAASKFNSEMLLVQTQAGASAAEVRRMIPAILSLSGQVAQAPEALATSLYHVESIGLRGAKALEVVSAAAKLATVSHSNLEETTNALTAAVASGIPGVQNMDQAIGMLNATVGAGDMKMSDLNQAMSSGLLTVVKGYGLSMRDVGAALAVFGDNNIRGANAATMLRMAVQAMAVPAHGGEQVLADLGITTGQTDKALSDIGITTKQLAGDMQHGGLNAAVTDLHDHLQAAGIKGNEVGAILTEAFGKKAGPGVAVLLAQYDRLQTKLEDLKRGGASFGDEWAATTKSASFQFAALRDQLEATGIRIGNVLLPIFAELAHDVAGVIGWLTGLPGPIQAGAAALGLFLLLRGPLSSFFETMALKAMYMVDTMAASEGVMATLKAAGGGLLSMFGGPWGLAITGVTIALGFLVSWLNKGKDATDGVAQAQTGLQQALESSKGAIDDNVRAAAAKEAADKGILDAAKLAGIALPQVTDAVLNQGNAFNETVTALVAYRDAHTGVNGAQTAGAIAANNAITALKGMNGEALTGVSTAQDLAAATGTTADAMDQAATSTDAVSKALEDTAKAASDAKKQTDMLKTSLDVLTGTQVSMNQAQSDFYAAVDAAKGALDKLTGSIFDNTGHLNLQSESGRKVNDVLTSVATAGNQLIATMESQGYTTEAVTAKDAELRASFITTATQMGISRQHAEDLANQIYGIPDSRTTQIDVNTTTALQKVQGFVKGLNDQGFFGLVLNAVVGNHADGGLIRGRGTGTSDSILSRLSDGEFVVKAAQVPKHLPLLHAINNGLPGFAAGGLVDFMGYLTTTAALDAKMAAAQSKAATPAVGALKNAPAAVSGNQAIVQALAAQRGWGSGAEWNALYALLMRESGFRNTAQNPTSTAYGMFQFLNSTWAGYGYGKTSDPRIQTLAGLSYIGSKYRDPLGAWAHETRFGWYDNGGWLMPGLTMAMNGTGKPERIPPPGQDAGGMAGLRIEGTLEIGGDGLARIVDGQIVSAVTTTLNMVGR